MKQARIYTEKVKEAEKIGLEVMSGSKVADTLRKDGEMLTSDLNHDTMIRVPFVGDFNAGKSSILNAMMGGDLLPTNITPETAVSYELLYSPIESIEQWRGDNMISKVLISDIDKLSVVPGDRVRVYINNELIRSLNERGIILVDMPGIDSGIEAHNNAILNYLNEGTHYMIFTDIEQGTIRNTSLKFIQELLQYGLSMSTFVSKADKKNAEEGAKVVDTVRSAIAKYVGGDVKVGLTSATEKNYKDIIEALDSLDVDSLVKRKYQERVVGFIGRIIEQMNLEMNLLGQNADKFENKIREINEEKAKAIASIRNNKTDAQPLDGSVQDIINDIHDALVGHATEIASKIYSKADSESIKAAIIQIIRPVMVNSFKRELSEYQESVSACLIEFSAKVETIINESDNKYLSSTEDLIGNLVGKDLLESVLKKGLEKMMIKFAGYKGLQTLLGGLLKALGPIVIIVINILPDILKLIFGKSSQEKIAEIARQFSDEAAGQICDAIRPEVVNMLQEQRKETDAIVEKIIADEAAKFDKTIQETILKQQQEKVEIEKRISEVKEASCKLHAIIADL